MTFAFAGLAANSTDFGFMVAMAIGWAAFAVPRETESPATMPGRRRMVTLGSLACFAVIAVAWSATSVADVAYLAARSSIQGGRVGEAIPRLELARRLDPGMALYARQLGAAQLLTDSASSAIESLDASVHLNPSDDLAWRTLALAHAATGDRVEAWAALERAVETQRSDPTNLVLTAKWQLEDGRDDDTLAALGEILQAWPDTVAAPGWNELLPPGVSSLNVIGVAIERWSEGHPAPQVTGIQHSLLTVMAGRNDAAEALADEWLGPALGAAYVAVMGCQPDASFLLEEAPAQARRTPVYWSLVARQSLLDGVADGRAERLYEIMADAPWFAPPFETLNPLNENGAGGYSADIWGYRRSPITWPEFDRLPSPEAGAARWLAEPREAVRSAGLHVALPRCG
jgi:tetratricopeptide (TPR) repeat protein